MRRSGIILGLIGFGLVAVVSAQEAAEKVAVPESLDVEAVVKQAETREVVEYWLDQGYKKLQAGQLSASMDSFKRALELDGTNKKARFGMGTVYIQKHEYRKALVLLNAMAEEHPKDYSLKNNIAWLYATAEDNSVRDGVKAIAIAQDALMLAPNDYHVWSTLAEAYYVSGKYDRALRSSEEALRMARVQRAGVKDLRDYQKQIEKSKKASEAMSLME